MTGLRIMKITKGRGDQDRAIEYFNSREKYYHQQMLLFPYCNSVGMSYVLSPDFWTHQGFSDLAPVS